MMPFKAGRRVFLINKSGWPWIVTDELVKKIKEVVYEHDWIWTRWMNLLFKSRDPSSMKLFGFENFVRGGSRNGSQFSTKQIGSHLHGDDSSDVFRNVSNSLIILSQVTTCGWLTTYLIWKGDQCSGNASPTRKNSKPRFPLKKSWSLYFGTEKKISLLIFCLRGK